MTNGADDRPFYSVQPLHGLIVSEVIRWGPFIIASASLMNSILKEELEFSAPELFLAFDSSNNELSYIICRNSNSTGIDRAAVENSEMILSFVAILNIAFLVYTDCHYTAQLPHEAYLLRGNVTLTFMSQSSAYSERQEHVGRGHAVLIPAPPFMIDQDAFERIVSHPLLVNIFSCIVCESRTELQDKLIWACRNFYFAVASSYPEAQIIGAVSSIDVLLSLEPTELEVLKSHGQKNMKPWELTWPLLGKSFMDKIVRFVETKGRASRQQHHCYDVRNGVVHNGRHCNSSDVVDSYRLAIRVIISIANSVMFYNTRVSVVLDLVTNYESCSEEGGGIITRPIANGDYLWYDRGMPDLLPFVVARFYGLYKDREASELNQNYCKAISVIVHQRQISNELAISALRQCALAAKSEAQLRDVTAIDVSEECRTSAIDSVGFCRAYSVLAWVERTDIDVKSPM